MSSHYNDLPLHFHHLTALVSWTDFTSGEVIATSTAVESVLQQLLNHLVRLSSNEGVFFFFLSRGWLLYTVFFHKTALNDLLICIRKALPVQKCSRILHLFSQSVLPLSVKEKWCSENDSKNIHKEKYLCLELLRKDESLSALLQFSLRSRCCMHKQREEHK